MAFPERDHRISLANAAAQTARFRKEKQNEIKAGMFPRSVYDALLAQPGCAGIRMYNGIGVDGSPSTILVAVDQDGNDIADGDLYDVVLLCPPFCSASNVLNGQGE